MKWFSGYILAGLILAGAGCSQITGQKAGEGKAIFSALQAAVEEAAAGIESSVVLVTLEGVKSSGGSSYSMVGGSIRRSSPSGTKSVNGVLMTAEGHILVPGIFKPGNVERLTVWVGDSEYPAKVVKADDQLGMTIVKIKTDDKLVPLARDQLADLETGSWCVVVRQSDEKQDFANFTTLGVCKGEIEGRYRRFYISPASSLNRGAPVIDLEGSLVGFIAGSDVLSLNDFNDDLQAFLDDATGVTSPEEEARRKGRMGVMLRAINKEFAKAHDLPKSGLWVTHVISDGPAFAAGVRGGDLIVALNGSPLKLSGQRAHSYFMKSLRPQVGREFAVTVIRDGKKVSCKGTFDKVPEDEKLRAKDIGIEVKSITESDIFAKNLFTSQGVLVTDVERGSPAATSSSFRSGLLMKNDVILEIAGRSTPNLDAFMRVLDDVRKDKPNVLLVYYRRGQVTGYAGLNLKIGENGKGGSK